MLHGSLLDIKCFSDCGYVESDVTRDPVCPALAPASVDYPADQTMPLLDPAIPPPPIKPEDLPHCPRCEDSGKTSLLRPGVVWFGERLPAGVLEEADDWVERGDIDIMLVIGTAAAVYPAAGYTNHAQRQGATVVVINPDPNAKKGLRNRDFFFQGDAAEILPRLLEGVIGQLQIPEQQPLENCTAEGG